MNTDYRFVAIGTGAGRPLRLAAFVIAAAAGLACLDALARGNAPAIDGGPALNALAKEARGNGVVQCLPSLDAVGSFLGVDGESGIVTYVNSQFPDQQMVSVSVEVPGKGGSTYLTATMAPNPINKCSFVYEAISYHPRKCSKVADTAFKGAPEVGELKKSITALDIGNGGRVFLLPAGSGCVAIKKEVFTR